MRMEKTEYEHSIYLYYIT